jgi:hypothetical protein
MKLDNAKLCPNCDEVYEGTSCPFCTQSEAILLKRVLDTPKQEPGLISKSDASA